MSLNIRFIECAIEQEAVDICDALENIAGERLAVLSKKFKGDGYIVIISGLDMNCAKDKKQDVEAYLKDCNIVVKTYPQMCTEGYFVNPENINKNITNHIVKALWVVAIVGATLFTYDYGMDMIEKGFMIINNLGG